MASIFEIKSAAHLRVFNTPSTQTVFEALLDAKATGGGDGSGGLTAHEAGESVGMSYESAHYHLRKLRSIGLVKVVAERPSGARPEKVFGLTCSRIELKRGRRGPAYVRELVRGVRLMLRRTEREYERAYHNSAQWTIQPRMVRHVGWLTAKDVKQLDRLDKQMEQVFREADARVGRNGRGNRERVSVTAVLSPTAHADS